MIDWRPLNVCEELITSPILIRSESLEVRPAMSGFCVAGLARPARVNTEEFGDSCNSGSRDQ
jgi:hypothetical protein